MSNLISETGRERILEFLLQELVFLSNAQNLQDKKISISKMMEAIQLYTNSDRVYVFETNDTGDCFSNTYEFCREGVTPQIYALTNVFAGDMPFWYKEFANGKSVVIEDVEDIRFTMPHEYELLKAQDITSVIAFPIYRAPLLYGFLGVDNPDITKSSELINLLGLIGGFLGSISESDGENSVFIMNQKEKPKPSTIERQNLYLEILCQEYTSVLYLDLITGLTSVIKTSPLSYMGYFLKNFEQAELDYNAIIHGFSDNYAVCDSQRFLQEMCVNNLRRSVKDNSHLTYRYELSAGAPGRKHFEVRIFKLAQDDGKCGVIIGLRYIDSIIKREREQQKQLENTLSEAKMNNEIISAISKIYFLIYRIDLEHNYYDEISRNSEVHHLTGKRGNASEKMFEICKTFVMQEYQETVNKFFDLSTLNERLKDEDTIAVEYKAKDGDWHLARFIVKKRDSSGNVTHVLYVTKLISDTKLKEQNLIVMAEEANRANEAKTDFLSRVSHDIRTPLNAINGFCEIAQANADDKNRLKECLDKIEVSCKYLEEIVNDVLDLTRIEDGNIVQYENKIRLRDEFAQMLETSAVGLGKKKLNLKYEVHDIQHEYVILDSNHTKQIIINLISNAIKYTPEGGTVKFEVFEENTCKKGYAKVCFRISDTGIGMDETFMKKMYDRFSRAVDTRINDVRGSGLGLAVVKELVDVLHGTIDVHSTLGKGTSFKLSFDCKITDIRMPSTKKETASYGNFHLLVAEDNELNYEVAQGILSLYGVSCERACNGLECVKKFEQAQPDTYQAILMDMQMPVMSGIEATYKIRALQKENAREIPIIGLTANAFESDVQKCLSAGMNAHFSKPFHANELLATIEKIIQENKKTDFAN